MKKNYGFSLVEFIAYISVLTIVLGAALFFALNVVRNERTVGDKVQIFDEADFALRQMIDNVRTAKYIETDTGLDTNYSLFTNSASSPCTNHCVLMVRQSKNDGSSNTNKIRFSTNNSNQIIMTISDNTSSIATTTRVLTSTRVKIDKLQIKCIGPGTCGSAPKSVQITLGLSNVANAADTQTLNTSATPRGY